MSDADTDEIKAAEEKLKESAQKLFAKVYENAQAGAQGGPQNFAGGAAGPDMGGAAQGTDDAGPDVVDGDYTEV